MKISALKGFGEMKIPARASLWYLAAGVIGKGVGFLSTLIFTRLLSTAEFGEFAVYMSWLGIGEVCVSAFLSGNVIYRGLSDFKDNKQAFISNVIGIYLLFSAVFCFLLFTFYFIFGHSTEIFPILIIQLLSDGIITAVMIEKKHSYSYREVVFINLLESAATLPLSFLLIRYANLGFIGRAFGYLIPSLIIALILVMRGHPPQLKRAYSAYLLPRMLPLVPSAVVLAVTSQADRLIINRAMSTEAAAKYSVVHSVGICGIFLVSTLSSALHPWISRKLSLSKFKEISEITEPALTSLSAFSLFLIATGPLAIGFIAPPEYAEALPALIPIAISIIPYFAANLNTAFLIFLEKGRLVSRTSIFSGVLGIAANFTLIPRFGYIGAGMSVLISSLASYFFGAYYVEKFSRSVILSGNFVSLRLGLTSAFAVGISLSYSVPSLIPLILIFPALSLLTSALSVKRVIFE